MFNLTQQERTVLLFLAGVIIVGSLLQIVSKESPALRQFFEFTQQRQALSKIDINTADLESLKKISYIGEATARAILETRQKRGRFKTLEHLLMVNGIGQRKLEIIKPYLKVDP